MINTVAALFITIAMIAAPEANAQSRRFHEQPVRRFFHRQPFRQYLHQPCRVASDRPDQPLHREQLDQPIQRKQHEQPLQRQQLFRCDHEPEHRFFHDEPLRGSSE